MRIITGIYKGRHFDIPRTFKARPTTDFAKENIFNVLQAYTDLDQFEAAREYLNMAKLELKDDDKDGHKLLEKTEKKIAKAEEKFEKRMKKDSEKKRILKEEREMLN